MNGPVGYTLGVARRRARGRRSPPAPDFDASTDPFRSDWLKLTPGQRIVRAWKLRKRIKDLEAAHDAQSLPRL
jgi:hypothetical protein